VPPDVTKGMNATALQPRAQALSHPGRKIFAGASSVAFCSAIAGLSATAKELVVARWFGRGLAQGERSPALYCGSSKMAHCQMVESAGAEM